MTAYETKKSLVSPSPIIKMNNKGLISKLLKSLIVMTIHVPCKECK